MVSVQSLAPYPAAQRVALLPSVVRILLTTFLEEMEASKQIGEQEIMIAAIYARTWIDEREKMMPKLKGPIDQAKVVQIADTLKQGFRGDAVLDSYDEDRSSQFYRISRGTALVHRVYVSKEFLDYHTAVQIDQLLQAWGAVEKIRAAGARLVTINNHGIQTVGE